MPISGIMETCPRLKAVTASLWQRVMRTKHLHTHNESTHFTRCLSTTRLVMIGLSSTVGVGIYVLIGVASKEYAGPAVLFSFVIAALVTIFNALCFSELAGRTSVTGALYTFTYQYIGEVVAFLIGWIQLLMYCASNASASRVWSGCLDSMFDMAVKNYTIQTIGKLEMGPPFGEFPDLLALVVTLCVVIVTSVGVYFSSFFNAVFAVISISVLLFATVLGFYFADINNWKNPDHGGFVPFGMSGVFAGASACFYAYQGYDMISMSAEEAKSPEKSVPRAIIIELMIVMVLYFAVACSFTLMVPYWEIDTLAPFPAAFALKGIEWAKYVVAIGTLLTLTNLSVIGVYGVARHTYIMSKDGLLFKCFSRVNKYTKTPLLATVLTGLATGIMAVILDLKNLIGFIVTLGFVNYTIMCSYVIIIRYRGQEDTSNNTCTISSLHDSHSTTLNTSQNTSDPQLRDTGVSDEELHMSDEEARNQPINDIHEQENISEISPSRQSSNERSENSEFGSQLVLKNDTNRQVSSKRPILGVKFLLLIIVLCALLLSLLILYSGEDIMKAKIDAIISIFLLSSLIVVSTFIISRHPQVNHFNHNFKVPLMPYLPVCAILCNVFLLVAVTDYSNAIVCIILLLIGALIYAILILKDTVESILEAIQTRTKLATEEEILLNDDDDESSNDL